MTDHLTTPRAEDLISVGTRISWGAILGGSFVALAIYFMLTVLGAAVGLSISDRVAPTTLHASAAWWAILTLAAAVFVGGVVTSLFTVGENKVEALTYGVIMWAFLLGLLLTLTAAGHRTGIMSMAHAGYGLPSSWDLNKTADKTASKTPQQNQEEQLTDTATRHAWYAFAGTWLSMFAAAGGGLLGAGPTFRLVSFVARPRHVNS